jgi:hypothetical protein
MKKKGYKAGGMKKKGYAKGKTVKPDFLDIDKDGDTTESMKAASGKKAGGMMKKKGYKRGKIVQGMKDPDTGKMLTIKGEKPDTIKIPEPPLSELLPGKKIIKRKAGGMMKKKGMANGGKVRGAGIAKKGVRPAKMR